MAAASWPAPSWSDSSFSNRFDPFFDAYAGQYLSDYDPRWLKAQCAAESGKQLDASALSPAGAGGVCQFMPGTWSDATRALSMIGTSRFNPRANIKAAAWLMRRYTAIWTSHRPPLAKLDLGKASYNAGPGNILKAQRESGGALLWGDISPYLHKVTGEHSRETITYVKRIDIYYQQLAAGD